MSEDKVELLTSSLDRWCGNCNKLIPTGVPYVMDFETYNSPSGRKQYKNYPSHIECRRKKHGTENK